MTKLKFSPWAKWDNRALQLKEHMQYPGIYALCISERNLEDQPFDWIENIAYFGMTNSLAGLQGRLSQFNNTIRDKNVGHGGADRFRHDYTDGDALANMLYVAVCSYKCNVRELSSENLLIQGQVAMAEYVAFAEYFERFKELPKYNNKKESKKYSKRTRTK